MHSVYIGIGSNIGDRMQNIRRALSEIGAHSANYIIKTSSVSETSPVDYTSQPDFLNCIALINTVMAPAELLAFLQKTEKEMGREKTIPKGPRIIDLDILLYDNIVLNSEELIIPHPEIKNRNFILKHLAELDPELRDPVTGGHYTSIAAG